MPVMRVRVDEKRSIAFASAVAAGFMLGASFGLFYEGVRSDVTATAVGAIAGALFIYAMKTIVARTEHAHVGELRGARGATALLMIGVMTIHSITEGIALGVSFANGQTLGVLIAIAIGIHNIPEGVAISLTLVPHGEPPWKAAMWSVVSSLPQPLMAVPAFLAVKRFEPLVEAGLGFAGGAMVWMVLFQLIPDSFVVGERARSIMTVVLSTAVMIGLEFAIGF